MRILITYATTEGQTRKICRFAADRLADRAHTVELLRAADAEGLDVGRFEAAILAGSVHLGKVQPELLDFANENGAALSRIRTLYLQVSAAAAGKDPAEWADLRKIADATERAFGWHPTRTEHVAGAFRFSEYDFFKSMAMRWIASQHGEKLDPHVDKEFTDWTALATVLDEWSAAG
ncbi:flavodoxin domain-containing protein [Tropicibacter oceani]|uniref:Flavodoxin domain-containing protein n=1 Tax=Tropicibacter oceani TaxID=3058420 RepID=A0ABY8QEK3_9RHOB|nr:flavodoxin domain-containing protein [Tropicibacter oceani]WGW02436.1 flavodoxin domain-containing protein [Tropicibacter oceani]